MDKRVDLGRLEAERARLIQLRARHAELKAAVLKSQREEAQSLQIYGVAKALAESLSWNDMAPRLTSGIQKIFGAFEFLLYAYSESGIVQLLHRRGNWSKEPPIQGAPPAEVKFLHPPVVQELVPVLSVPMANGLLFLKSSDKNLSEQDLLDAGKEFGEQLGVALNKALLFSQMEMHSRIDGMTGALRRQAFMDRFDDELKRAAAFHVPLSVMMLDIDHFKSVNDSHGHAAGDAVLARVGQILKETFYETDIVGRYGGEEFVVLMPRAQADGVFRKAESLRQRFEREMIASGFEKIQITVSIGLAHYPEDGKISAALIAAADKALYRAKETGRNKVVAA